MHIINVWMVKLWQIDGQSPNSPIFSPANVSHYTVLENLRARVTLPLVSATAVNFTHLSKHDHSFNSVIAYAWSLVL